MDTQRVAFATAVIAGLLSFFSPCVLPLVPVYLGYMTGTVASDTDPSHRLTTLVHAIFFVLGFAVIFALMGATAGFVGRIIGPVMPYLVKVGGVILIVLGLHLTGLISIPLLNVDKRLQLGTGRAKSYGTSFLVGLVFAAGWTPCVGPVLAAILLLAADTRTGGTGAMLLAAYALGLGLPFLAVAGMVDAATPLLRRASRYLRIASILGGGLLILMGFLLLTGWFDALMFWVGSFASLE